MKHTAILLLFATATILLGCTKKEAAPTDAEALGREWVNRARSYMQAGQWEQARAMIDSLRERTPAALNAREDGILVLDSIELLNARQQEDSLRANPLLNSSDMILQDSAQTLLDRAATKVRFYEEKISYDLQHKQVHTDIPEH